LSVADEAAGKGEEGFVDVGSAFVADAEASILVQPGEGALDHPALAADSGSVWCVAFGDERLDAAGAELVAVGSGVVAAVGEEDLRSASRSSALAPDGRMASRSGSSWVTSGRLAAVRRPASGIP
jgi:hypothetical protein